LHKWQKTSILGKTKTQYSARRNVITMMEEQELAHRCARRDRQAREELFRRYSPRLLALCLRYTRDRDEADDLLQDAFIKVFDRIGRFRWQGSGTPQKTAFLNPSGGKCYGAAGLLSPAGIRQKDERPEQGGQYLLE